MVRNIHLHKFSKAVEALQCAIHYFLLPPLKEIHYVDFGAYNYLNIIFLYMYCFEYFNIILK